MKKSFILLFTFCVIPLISCENEKEETFVDTEVNSIVLFVDGTKDLGIKGDFLTSDDRFVASVSEEGIVTANHVGTTIINSKTKKIPTVVMGIYHMYDDPITDWGCSPNEVISKHKQGTLKGGYSKNSLVYENVGSATALSYSFDENDKLKSIGVLFPISYLSRVTDHLMERFFMIPYVDGDIMAAGFNAYDKEKQTVAVSIMYVNTSYFMVVYIPGPAING